MKIAILGSGNAGCAHAFKFTQKGHEVALIKTSHSLHETNFDKIVAQGGIWGIDDTENKHKSFQKIDLITRNIEAGLKDADIILVLTQSLQHEDVAKKIAPFVPNTVKLLFVVPGNMGSLFFKKHLQNSSIIFAEGESTAFDARIIEPGVVNILFKNVRNAVAFLPRQKKEEGMRYISQLTDTYGYYRTNIVESALHNPNLVVHTIGVIMSAARIEMMKGEFWMYRESFSPAIWNLITQLDKEKNDVIQAFGGNPITYLDACKFRNEKDQTKDALEVFKSYAENGGPKGPDTLDTRYLHEDVVVGLGLLSMLGKISNINTPVANALMVIASSMVNKDFFQASRTLKDFGVEDLTLNQFIQLINE